MNKIIKNEKGFSAVEIILVIVIIALISVVGWLVYKDHHKTTTINTPPTYSKATSKSTASNNTKSAATANPYAGWKTYNLASFGLSFKYPNTWTVTQGQPQCTGAIIVTAIPGNTELSQAATTISANLKQYTIFFDKYGTESSKCGPDGNSWKGDTYTYLQSSDQISSGVFKGDWLTFFGSTTGNKSQTLPDTAVVTDYDYKSSPNTFVDTGTVSYNNAIYQIEVNTSSVIGQQYAMPVPMNVSLFKTTQLYKDTLNMLNSIQG